MSDLQRSLLRHGLWAYYRTPFDIACRLPDPGCFRLRAMTMDFEDRRVRASRRATAGLSIARLIKRGLVECCARGRWRLTPAGLKIARRLYPILSPRQSANWPAISPFASDCCLGKRSSSTVRQAPQTHQCAPSGSNQHRRFRKRKAGHRSEARLEWSLIGQKQPLAQVLPLGERLW
jgi:hypothetical protein